MSFGLLIDTILQTLFIFVFVFILVPFRMTLKKSLLIFGSVVAFLCIVTAYVTAQYGTMLLYRYGYATIGIPTLLVIYLLSKARGVRLIFITLTTMIFHQMLSTLLMVFRVYTGGFTLLYFLMNILMFGALMFGGFKIRKDFHQIIFTYQAEFCCLCPILLLLFGMMSLFAPLTSSETVDIDLLYLSIGIYLLIILLYLYITVNFRSMSRSLEVQRGSLSLVHQREEAQAHIALLRSFQEKTAVQRHDLRHHISLIQGLLDAEQPQRLREYLAEIQAEVDKDTPACYCQNEAVDLLLHSFGNKAQNAGVMLHTDARLPHSLPITSTEFCTLLSNALENAVIAASLVADGREKTVRLMTELRDGKLLILVENPYSGVVRMNGGLPLSEREGHGFGVKSMVAITEKYNGLSSFEAKDGIFTVRIAI